MSDVQSLNHSKWECKYHLTWIPKCRRKILYGGLRKHLGGVFRDLARRKECEILEGHLMEDHVHMLVSIPPKYAVSQVIGYLKGKSKRGQVLYACRGLSMMVYCQNIV